MNLKYSPYEAQHHHLLSCLERTTVSLTSLMLNEYNIYKYIEISDLSPKLSLGSTIPFTDAEVHSLHISAKKHIRKYRWP